MRFHIMNRSYGLALYQREERFHRVAVADHQARSPA